MDFACPPPVFKIAMDLNQFALKALWTTVPAAPLFKAASPTPHSKVRICAQKTGGGQDGFRLAGPDFSSNPISGGFLLEGVLPKSFFKIFNIMPRF